jgi:hypothetical protein
MQSDDISDTIPSPPPIDSIQPPPNTILDNNIPDFEEYFSEDTE